MVGGYPKKAADGGKAFVKELVRGHRGSIRVLICLFAKPRNEWSLVNDRLFLKKFLSSHRLIFRSADIKSFGRQVRWADIVYVKGGSTRRLMASLNRLRGWEKQLAGKTIAGTSAGAEMISAYYYHADQKWVGKGFGLVPIKVLVHYGSKEYRPTRGWSAAKKELGKFREKENVKLLTLREGEFKVIEIR